MIFDDDDDEMIMMMMIMMIITAVRLGTMMVIYKYQAALQKLKKLKYSQGSSTTSTFSLIYNYYSGILLTVCIF